VTQDAAAEFVRRVRAARLTARVDAVTAEVVGALDAAGVRPLLLKGPVHASLLYGEDEARSYIDADLLVAPHQLGAAERCLARLGFAQALGDADVPGSEVAGDTWRRPGGDPAVDLHRTLPGVRASPADLWAAVSDATRWTRVGGRDVEIPSVPACALVVALHAAHHGTTVAHPLEDLRRAVDLLDRETWAAAARLAARVDALDELAGGLTLDADGAHLARELSLPSRLPLELELRRGSPPPGVTALEALASTPGVAARLRLVARKIVPSRRFMHYWFPRARRGRGWLVLGYLWRPAWLAWRAGPALAAWLRARGRMR
jgi:hypothetical protein